nr:MAG TPA: hypothetical protein [Caudoviricetes sp.]
MSCFLSKNNLTSNSRKCRIRLNIGHLSCSNHIDYSTINGTIKLL